VKPYEYLDSLPLTLNERQLLIRSGYASAEQLLMEIRLHGDAYVTLLGRDNRLEVIPLLRGLLPVPLLPVPVEAHKGWGTRHLGGLVSAVGPVVVLLLCLWFGRGCLAVRY